MTDVGSAFLTAGVILVIGFIAAYIFHRTGFPDVIALLIVGLILGPLNRYFFCIHQLDFISDTSTLDSVTPYLIGLAIALILFDGGLNFPHEEGCPALLALVFSGLTMFFSILGTALVAATILGYPLILAILLGVILGGISSAVVLSVVHNLALSQDGSRYLQIDAIFTDIVGILLALAIIDIMAAGSSFEAAIAEFFISLAIGVAGGLLTGFLWRTLWKHLKEIRYAFMLTVAVLILNYGLIEVLGGSGACSSFIFGAILAYTRKGEKMDSSIKYDLKPFCGELTFFSRTFFFVLLGLLFSLYGVRDIGIFILAASLIVFILYLMRRFSIFLFSKVYDRIRKEEHILTMVMARGLGAAMLSMLPFHIPQYTPGTAYFQMISPYQGEIIDITFIVIIATIILTAVGTGMRISGLSPLEEND